MVARHYRWFLMRGNIYLTFVLCSKNPRAARRLARGAGAEMSSGERCHSGTGGERRRKASILRQSSYRTLPAVVLFVPVPTDSEKDF